MKSILLVDIVFSWGHMIRPPYQSGGGQALPYPPPTTLIGALAAPYLRLREPVEIIYHDKKAYSPAAKLLDIVSYAVMGYPKPCVTEIIDINKYYSYAYLRPKYKKDERFWSAAIGTGKIYSPSNAVIAYIVEQEYGEELAKAAWGITRIGSKEGLVSVRNVKLVKKPTVIEEQKTISTIFPTPLNIVEPRENCRIIYFWKIMREAYTSYMPKEYEEYLDKYVVPEFTSRVYGGSMKVKPLENAVVVETPYSPLILPKEKLGIR